MLFKTYTLVLVLALSSLLAGFGKISRSEFRVRPEDSRVTFTLSKWTVFNVEGRFTDFSGRINYDENAPEDLTVTFEVDVRSVDTHNRTRNRRIMAEDFFDAKQYPTMTFQSTGVSARDDGNLNVVGDLTIKGITRQIEIVAVPLGINRVPDFGTLAGFRTEFQIDRTDFNVTGHRWSGGKNILGHQIDIKVLVAAELK